MHNKETNANGAVMQIAQSGIYLVFMSISHCFGSVNNKFKMHSYIFCTGAFMSQYLI